MTSHNLSRRPSWPNKRCQMDIKFGPKLDILFLDIGGSVIRWIIPLWHIFDPIIWGVILGTTRRVKWTLIIIGQNLHKFHKFRRELLRYTLVCNITYLIRFWYLPIHPDTCISYICALHKKWSWINCH